MNPISIHRITTAIEGDLNQEPAAVDRLISSLSIDSRTLVDPEACLFFALVGERHNGHQFLHELYEKGVRSFVVSELPVNREVMKDASFIVVEDTLKALQQLAASIRDEFRFPVVAITGSNGKTIVKEWLFDLLQHQLRIVRSPKSYNSQVGVPLSVWSMAGTMAIGVVEAG
nr:bifunctional UDP-N-acetylmuramoyl-tripeptide:D-alanyl-D-alanine ligase/alanine racemase [Sunxiuqinia sp.]